MTIGVGADNINPQMVLMKTVFDTSEDGKVVFFCTSIADRNKVQNKVKRYLDQRESSVDMININGCQCKEEKFGNMRIFSGEKRISELNPRVGVFTAAANTGFDIPNLALVVRVRFPPDLLTMIQEKGRLV